MWWLWIVIPLVVLFILLAIVTKGAIIVELLEVITDIFD